MFALFGFTVEKVYVPLFFVSSVFKYEIPLRFATSNWVPGVVMFMVIVLSEYVRSGAVGSLNVPW